MYGVNGVGNAFEFDGTVFTLIETGMATDTPDFIGDDFIIETKGSANESFPMRWKLFKRLVMNQFPNVTLYKPHNQKDCE